MAKRKSFDLKKFRHSIAELKRKGILKNVDAKTAQPFFIRSGKTLKETVAKFDDVLSGKVQPVKLPPKKIKELGYEKTTVGKESFAMVPVSAGEKVRLKDGSITIVEPSGVQRIKQAVPFDKRLDQYLTKLKRSQKRINKMKADNEWFAFKVFGRRSWRVYRSIDDLVDDLRAYKSWQSAMSARLKKQLDLYEHLEIIRVPDQDVWHADKEREVSKKDAKRIAKQRSKWKTKAKRRKK